MKAKVNIHDSSKSYVTGQAEYVDDRPFVAGEVFVDVFYSPVAHGRIIKIDTTQALRDEDVIAIYSAQDLHHNLWGSIFQDQPFLAESTVNYVGEPILVIVAKNKDALIPAKRKIKIEIEELPPILTIEDAISKRAFIGPLRKIERGDVAAGFAKSKNKISGVIKMAGQDHFYLESQACIAYPKEDGQIEIHSSSQHPTEVQHLVAEALGLKFNQVVCIVKRMGGAFGGKESQAAPFAVFASMVAQKLRRPARLILSKDDDMQITGKRNPFHNYYHVGFDDNGKINALTVELYSDGGAYADLSTAIMERAMLHSDNAYFIPNMSVSGQVCKTHTAPNTAFRGFGGPKGILTIENIIEEIAIQLKKDSLSIREANVYQIGEATHYNQIIDDNVLPELFQKIKISSDYEKRRQEIVQFNKSENQTVRGLSCTAVKFGISFTTRFLNQANALVNLHMDGTVQVSTGATEMGQGVNTKIAQVVAEVFSIPTTDVRVMPTSTEKNHNTSATAASSGSDLNGQAARLAALEIRQRLSKMAYAVLNRNENLRGRKVAGSGTAEEIKIDILPDVEMVFENGFVFDPAHPNKKISLKDLIEEAYLNRISMGGYGYYRYPNIFFNKETGKGNPFYYYTNAVAVSEVSVDRLTGEVKVLRSDLLVDLGRPLNHEIDMGQVTGAFVQGLGWVTTEKLYYTKKGELKTYSPSTYKIPSVHDIPRIFNVAFLENLKNDKNLRGSKAVGEPPLMLAISVWTAVKNAISYCRQDSVSLSVPATQETVLMSLNEAAP